MCVVDIAVVLRIIPCQLQQIWLCTVLIRLSSIVRELITNNHFEAWSAQQNHISCVNKSAFIQIYLCLSINKIYLIFQRRLPQWNNNFIFTISAKSSDILSTVSCHHHPQLPRLWCYALICKYVCVLAEKASFTRYLNWPFCQSAGDGRFNALHPLKYKLVVKRMWSGY